MGAKEETILDLAYPKSRVAPLIETALRSIGARVLTSEPEPGKWTAETSFSLRSMSETIAVEASETGFGSVETRTRVHATSETAQLFDWGGKNRQNLQEFREALEKLLRDQSPDPPPEKRRILPPITLDDLISKPAPPPAAVPAPRAAAAAATPAVVTRRIFVSYRRDDTGTVVGRLCDRLVQDLGAENVFKDVDNIPFGVDFVEHINREVEKCTVLFAVIGPRWLKVEGVKGSRLHKSNDYVRIEIAAALKRRILVVPLLVEGAEMPSENDLPDDLKPLARRNGTEIRRDPDFHSDVTRLLSRLG